MGIRQHPPIALLGNGITASYVKDFAKRHNIDIVDPSQASLVITSPGIPPSQFPDVDVPIISDIEWAYRLFQESGDPPKLIAVTGTNGKSTVTAMISDVCDIPYAGNIGIPLISYVGLEAEFPAIVVEVSSYQLETCVDFTPDIGVFLNITPDHLARHGTSKEYLNQKKKCFQHQSQDHFLIYNSDDKQVSAVAKTSKATTIAFNQAMWDNSFPPLEKLPGKHNQLNILATQKVAELLEIPKHIINFSLTQFKPLKHRLEVVETVNNITIVNDSKATNPESTLSALDSFKQPIWLICCGQDKQLDLTQFATNIVKKSVGLIVFGDIAQPLTEAIKLAEADFEVKTCQTVNQAVDLAFQQAVSGQVILFSPSSSSQDQFKNFEQRGHLFVQEVEDYVKSLMV